MKKTIKIKYATSKDYESIAAFRIKEYKTAKEFEILDLKALSKQRGNVLIAELDGEIISTMQFEIIESFADLKKTDDNITDEVDFNAFATLYLSKGATRKEFRNTGLNSLLRKVSLQYALQNNNIFSLSGIAYENAPRLNLLQKLGYSITILKHSDKTYSKPKGKILFLCLPRNKFSSALDLLKLEVSGLQDKYVVEIHNLNPIHQ